MSCYVESNVYPFNIMFRISTNKCVGVTIVVHAINSKSPFVNEHHCIVE